jgi:hypothetical protein
VGTALLEFFKNYVFCTTRHNVQLKNSHTVTTLLFYIVDTLHVGHAVRCVVMLASTSYDAALSRVNLSQYGTYTLHAG